jgi:hypothetical protein
MMGRAWKLALLQLLGNAFLLWLGYTWLGIGESNGSMLALSGVVVLLLTVGVVLLQGTSLAYFRAPEDRLRRTLGNVVRRVAPLIIVGMVAVLLYLGLWLWDPKPLVLWLASGLTYLTQSPVRPAWILRVVEYVLMAVRWCVLPVFLVPLVSGIATRGWQGWREYRAQFKNWRYWVIVPVALAAGVWLPLWLVAWTPVRGSFTSEMVSFVARYSAAYLLFVAAALVLAFATSRGRPAVTQESTTVSP